MLPSDIGGIVAAGSPAVSPDGRLVAYTVVRVDLSGNTYRSRIWLAAADGSSPPEPLTSGEHGDSNPVWSPDGRRLAFTSRRGDDGKASLHVIPVDRPGETVTLCTRKEAITSPVWSPDGRLLAFVSRERDARYESDDPKRQPPRKVTRFFARLDNDGWQADRPSHLFVVPADGSAEPVDVTPGEHQVAQPSWSPDSRRVALSGSVHETWDLDLASDLLVVDVDLAAEPGPVTPLTDHTASLAFPSWSPDGTRIAFLGFDDLASSPWNSHVGVLDVASGERRWLTTGLDRTCAPFPGAREPLWDGDDLLFAVEDRGATHVYRVRADGSGAPEPVVTGERRLSAFHAAGGTLAFSAATTTRPPEVFAVTGVVGGPNGAGVMERALTDVGATFAERAKLQPYEHFTSPNGEGVDIDTWVLLPPGFDPDGSYPALLNIHGGPFTQYGVGFFDEAQVQAGAGYVVILPNPRGGSGRTDAWGRAIVIEPGEPDGPGKGWGSVDYDDLMAVVDEVLRRYPAVDRERLGVLGGSYGGYMASWIVGHTDRFKAACSERAVNNLLTMEWTSDIATVFRTEVGASHLEDPARYSRMSPVTYVRDITTPLLIVHSEDDLRCPISQAEELFVAMRLLGKAVEFVRFPAEGHELTRSGSPVHRVQRAEVLLEFFDRHLKPAPADRPERDARPSPA